MTRAEIEALDVEIQNLEKTMDSQTGMARITATGERLHSLTLEKQRLLALEASEVPVDIRDQLLVIDAAILKLEDEATKIVSDMAGVFGAPGDMHRRLTALKVKKSEMLSRYPSLIVKPEPSSRSGVSL